MRAFVIAVLACAACGPSGATLKVARAAEYDAPFSTVWNAVVEEVSRRYPSMREENPIQGVVITNWRMIETSETTGTSEDSQAGNAAQTAQGTAARGQFTTCLTPQKVFRVMVEVRGKTRSGPWHLNVDGEAAECQPGMAVLTPYHHGMPDEPPWVESRIAALTVAIHERLKTHLIKQEVPVNVVATKVHDDTPWANVPDRAAVSVIGKVHQAAVRRDAAALRPTMSEDFGYNTGAEGSADMAIALFSADPTKMRDLARILEGGCGADGEDVVCPTKAEGAQARFRKVGSDWKFIGFGLPQ